MVISLIVPRAFIHFVSHIPKHRRFDVHMGIILYLIYMCLAYHLLHVAAHVRL